MEWLQVSQYIMHLFHLCKADLFFIWYWHQKADIKTAMPLPISSPVVDEERMTGHWFQCFDTDNWVTQGHQFRHIIPQDSVCLLTLRALQMFVLLLLLRFSSATGGKRETG